MKIFKFNISYKYFEFALRYCENRNNFFGKLTLLIIYSIVKKLKNEEKIKFIQNKLRLFWEGYF
jgi:hypothetical protein